VQGLKSAKEIWDVLKTAHEGDEVTKITKRKTIEGELGRFILNQGEEPQAMYNRLNISISNLRNENAILYAKIDELKSCKPSTSSVDHVPICTRCRDVNVDAIHDHLALIKEQNDHIAQLTAKINEHEIENEKFKFARSMLYNGRRPGIKNGIGFQQGDNVKLNAPKRLSNFVKGKAHMA
jgi:hypothetical protein